MDVAPGTRMHVAEFMEVDRASEHRLRFDVRVR